MLRNLALLLFPISLFSAETFDFDVYVFGASYHTNRSIPYNEKNSGFGLGFAHETTDNLDLTIAGGFYIDSFNRTASFAMVGVRPFIGKRESLHASLGCSVGYLDGSGSNGFGILPIASIGYDQVDLCFTVDLDKDANQSRDDSAARTSSIAFFLKVRFGTF